MPRLSYPKGRQAAAAVAPPAEDTENPDLEHDEVIKPEADETIDPTLALKQQIEALEKSNKEYADRVETERRRAEEASRLAQQRGTEVDQLRKDTFASQAEAVNAALTAANAEAEAARHDIEAALQIGDNKAQSEAYRRLSKADASIARLEYGKEQIERQVQEEAAKPAPQSDPLAHINIPEVAKDWLRKNPQYLTNARLNAKLQALHWDLLDEGYGEYSPEYFSEVDRRIKMKRQLIQQVEEMEEEVEENPRKVNVSAPPSREVPTSSGTRPSQIRLTVAQKEAAKIAGISEADYALQLKRLQQEKSIGNYGGGG